MGRTKFTVRISRTLRRRIEEEARNRGETMSELVRRKLKPLEEVSPWVTY